MIEILEETQGDLIAAKVKGKITEQDYEIFIPVLEKTLKDYNRPNLYCEVYELELPSPKAIWEELKNIPNYNKLGKCAIVSDQKWLDTMAKVADKPMTPDIKFFSFEQKAQAKEWVK